MHKKSDLNEEYIRILHLLRDIDRRFQKTNDQSEMLTLIEQREPLSLQLEEIYDRIIDRTGRKGKL